MVVKTRTDMKQYVLSGIRWKALVSFVMTAIAIQAQVSVTRIESGAKKPDRDGFVYVLPLTAIKVTLSVKETELVKGPYAEYADEYLGLKNPVLANGREYELLDVHLEAVAQPDPDRFYFVEVDERTSKDDRNIIFSLAGSGFLKAVNSGFSVPDVLKSARTEMKTFNTPDLFPFSTSPSQYRKTDTIIRIVTVDTASVKKRFFKTSFDEKPSEQKAREAADMVARLREGLVNLLSGFQEISYDPNTLKYMVENIQSLREEYISMFKGLRLEKVQTFTYLIVPEEDKSSMPVTICKFSKEFGVSDQADAKARDVVVTFRRDATTAALAGFIPKGSSTGKSSVLWYRIPEMTQVMVKFQNQLFDNISVPVSQFGAVVPVSLNKTRIELDESTGALKSVFFE